MQARQTGDLHLLSGVQAVRIVLGHVNSDYADCVFRLLGKVSLRKEISAIRYAYEEVEGSEAEYTDMNGAHDRSFNGDWLPEWGLLRGALNSEFKRLKSLKLSAKGMQAKLPVAFGGTDRQGMWCHACGPKGHKKGSEEHKAGKFDVHESAPKDFKKRMFAKKKKDGGYSPGSLRSGAVPKSEQPCSQFQNEEACRFGKKCKFSHDGVTGGGNKDQKTKKLSTY